MTRAEATAKFAQISKDSKYLADFAAGDPIAIATQREIAAALVGEDQVNYQSGQWTKEEKDQINGPR